MKVVNFSVIKTIGILSNPKSEFELKELKEITKYLNSLGKETFPIIYCSNETIANQNFQGEAWLSLNKKNCNWLGKPIENSKIKHFLDTEFDILFDLSYSANFSLNYLFVQSKALLKVMPTSETSEDFADLMLKVPDVKNKMAYIKHSIHYLEILNKTP